MKPYYRYIDDVSKGKVVVGQNIRLAVTRFQNDLKKADFEFREDVVDKAISFISTLKHFTGKSSGNNFVLEDWQAFIVANIVGWYWKGTDNRRFSSSYIEISRKQGKTALAAALCIYFLIADGEDGAEVDLAANSKDQAKIAFSFCSAFTK